MSVSNVAVQATEELDSLSSAIRDLAQPIRAVQALLTDALGANSAEATAKLEPLAHSHGRRSLPVDEAE